MNITQDIRVESFMVDVPRFELKGLYHAKVAIFQLIYTPKWVLTQPAHLSRRHRLPRRK